MADSSFNVNSRFNKEASFKKVVFGSEAPLLEAELNEVQDIQNFRLNNLVLTTFGNRPLYEGTYTVANGVLIVENEFVSIDGELIEVNARIAVAEGDGIYLIKQEKTLGYTDTVVKGGNKGSSEAVPNGMYDERVGVETTRRVQVQYALAKAPSGASVWLGAIVNGAFLKESGHGIKTPKEAGALLDAHNEQLAASKKKTVVVTEHNSLLPGAVGNMMSVDSIKGSTLKNFSIVKTGANNYFMPDRINSMYYHDYHTKEGSPFHSDSSFVEGATYTVLYEQSGRPVVNGHDLAGSVIFYTDRPHDDDGVLMEKMVYLNLPLVFTVPAGFKYVNFRGLRANTPHSTPNTGYRFTVLEGDWTGKAIPPYFEGIKSVGTDTNAVKIDSIGKNLAYLQGHGDGGIEADWLHLAEAVVLGPNDAVVTTKQDKGVVEGDPRVSFGCISIPKLPRGTYMLSYKVEVLEGDIDKLRPLIVMLSDFNGNDLTGMKNRVWLSAGIGEFTVDTSHHTGTMLYIYAQSNETHTATPGKVRFYDIMIKRSSDTAAYEPSKLSSLEIPLDEPLRSLPNGVADEIKDGKLIRRVGKTVLTDADEWRVNSALAGNTLFYLNLDTHKDLVNMKPNNIMSDILPTRHFPPSDVRGISYLPAPYNAVLYVNCGLVGNNIEPFTDWVRDNPITLCYELKEPVVSKISYDTALTLYADGCVRLPNMTRPNVTLSYGTNVASRLEQVEVVAGGHSMGINNLWLSLLPIADKELRMQSIELLGTDTAEDLKNKVNEIITIWRS